MKEETMKRFHISAVVSRSLLVLAMLAIFVGLPAASNAQTLLSGSLTTYTISSSDASSVFYTTSGAGTGLPNGAEIVAINVTGRHISFRDIGPTFGGDCASLALSPRGTLYSMCGPTFGAQKLATINRNTGRATLFGVPVSGLAVMALTFGPNGVLYAVGDCNPDPTTFECTHGSDPHYNSLFTVNVTTGAFTRVGATGAPQFFMDLTFDRDGHMLGVTSTVNPSALPAILYRIDPTTGKATRLVTLVGSNSVMGLAFGRDGKLYATDNPQNPGLYLIDAKMGFETAIAAVPFGFSSDLVLVNPN
jgi:hypothetical protein